jgi:hypothetical protein
MLGRVLGRGILSLEPTLRGHLVGREMQPARLFHKARSPEFAERRRMLEYQLDLG